MPTQPIYNGDYLVECGDSIVTGGVFNVAEAAITADLAASPTTGRATATGGQGTATGGVGVSQPIAGSVIFFHRGLSGSRIAYIDVNFATVIANVAPDDVWIHTGINDVQAPTLLTDFTASWVSLIAKLQALPKVPRLWVDSILCDTERWTAGPLRWSGPHDAPASPSIDDYNAAVIAAMGGYGIYVDARAAFLALEPTGNPGSADDGYLIAPGALKIHPNPTGQAVVSNALLATVQVIN
jgi:hypothetical protein